jgi:tetratricopeptide (TPR) repeat protein
VSLLVLLALPISVAHGSVATPGLVEYLQGHDRAAVATLTAEIARGDAPLKAYLALSDLSLRHADLASARRILEASSDANLDPEFASVPIWAAWVDFLDGRSAQAREALIPLTRERPGSALALEAAFSLGWQLLLAGDPASAASAFDQVVAQSNRRNGLADHARLLEGQALMWSGQVVAARERLTALLARAPTSRVADDAARDLAWCAFLQGDREAAMVELDRVASEYLDQRFIGRGFVRTRWPRVAISGPTVLRKPLLRAFRTRPRGQLPLEFLVSVGDRFAARDARHLRAMIARSRDDARPAIVYLSGPAPDIDAGMIASPQAPRPPSANGTRRRSWLRWLTLLGGVSFAMIAVGARRAARTRSVRANGRAWP